MDVDWQKGADVMMIVGSPEHAEVELRAGEIACPGCWAGLRPYVHARDHTGRGLVATRLTVRPRRARCAGCVAGRVVRQPSRRVEIIGPALAAKAAGSG